MAEVLSTKLHEIKNLKLYGGVHNVAFPLITYAKTGQKLLYICDTLSGQDVKNGVILNSDAGETISRAFDLAVEFNNNEPPKSIYITSNYIAKLKNSLSERQHARNNRRITAYLIKLIKTYKPDTVIFAGPKLVENWVQYKHLRFAKPFDKLNLPELHEKINVYRGHLIPVSIESYQCNIIQTFSPRHIASSDPKHFANVVQLLGMATRDFETAIRGTNLYSLADIQPVIKHILDIKTFDKFFKLLLKTKTPAIDTEGLNLNRIYDNKLFVILFCLDGITCWQLPIFHKDTPFTGKELNYIMEKLRWYFEFGEKSLHIYQNAKFDLHMFYSTLKLRYYNHKIYDLMVGEFALEENRKFVRSAGINSGYTLESISSQYGGIGYLDTVIGKVDRANMAKYNLDEIAEYGALDIIYPYRIARFHAREAKRRGDAYKGFHKTVSQLGSDILYVFTTMERNGLLVDKQYLGSLMAPNSEINQQGIKAAQAFRTSRAVHKANRILLKDKKVPKTAGIFGTAETPFIFDINKAKHKQILYFDVLKLRPVQFRKDGGGKLGKPFNAEYADTVPEVKMLSTYDKLKQLKSTYIDGLYKKLGNYPDGKDWRLRSNYVLVTILTWRSASTSPNMQNIPSRGELAKIIKRMFIASMGNIIVKLDFKAHEVRGWGNISQDPNIANSFKLGLDIINALRLARLNDPDIDQELFEWMEEVDWSGKKTTFDDRVKFVKRLGNRKELQKLAKMLLELQIKGDSHRVNYELFYGKPAATVTDDERQDVKQVVFGTIYGKMAMALARDVYKVVKQIEAKYRNKSYGMDEKSPEYDELMQQKYKEIRPHKEKAQGLINTLFTKFKKGGDWLKNVHREGKENYTVTSIFGAVRHLWGYLHFDEKVHGMMDRRGPNSIIQGPSSNIGYTGAKIMLDICWELAQYNISLNYMMGNMVHDSVETETMIKSIPLMLYYLEHSMTSQTHKRLREMYNFIPLVDLEVDIEIGPTLAKMGKWDFSSASLYDNVAKSIDWFNKELNYNLNKNELLKAVKYNQAIIEPYRAKELEKKLKDDKISETMLITPKLASKLGFKL